MTGWDTTPSGKFGFSVEKILTHGPKKTCIAASSRDCEAVYTVPIERFTGRGLTAEDLMTKVVFKGGCHIACGGEVSFVALDEDENIIYEQLLSAELQESTDSFRKYSQKELTYNPSE